MDKVYIFIISILHCTQVKCGGRVRIVRNLNIQNIDENTIFGRPVQNVHRYGGGLGGGSFGGNQRHFPTFEDNRALNRAFGGFVGDSRGMNQNSGRNKRGQTNLDYVTYNGDRGRITQDQGIFNGDRNGITPEPGYFNDDRRGINNEQNIFNGDRRGSTQDQGYFNDGRNGISQGDRQGDRGIHRSFNNFNEESYGMNRNFDTNFDTNRAMNRDFGNFYGLDGFGTFSGLGGYSAGSRTSNNERAGSVIPAAISSKHTVEFIDVNLPKNDVKPQVIEIGSTQVPLVIQFKTSSSPLRILHSHEPSVPIEEQRTQSEDEPTRMFHEVTKPIVQEVREIITPYRRVVQEIRPVVEEIQTIVARGQERRQNKVDVGTNNQNGGYNQGNLIGSRQRSGYNADNAGLVNSFGTSTFGGPLFENESNQRTGVAKSTSFQQNYKS